MTVTMSVAVTSVTLDQPNTLLNSQKHDYSGQHPQADTHVVSVAFVLAITVAMSVVVSMAVTVTMAIMRMRLDGMRN